MKDIVKLAVDAYKGTTGQFSKAEASETLRKALLDLNGGQNIDYKAFRRNKVEIFEIIEEVLTIVVSQGLEDQFSDFAEIRNLGWGDTNVFNITSQDLFKVAAIADGTGNLRRQRLENKQITVGIGTYGVRIYDELYRFLAGRVDWVEMVNRVARSYNQKIATDVYSAIYNSYSTLTTPYAVSAVYAEDTLTQMCQHVEAASNEAVDSAMIFGTKVALSKVVPTKTSNLMMDTRNKLGYYGILNGYEMREIKQAHVAGTDTFAIDDNFLLVVPKSIDKFVKIVNEGEALIVDGRGNGDMNADMSLEYTFIMKAGIAVIPTHKYGIYRLA